MDSRNYLIHNVACDSFLACLDYRRGGAELPDPPAAPASAGPAGGRGSRDPGGRSENAGQEGGRVSGCTRIAKEGN